MTWFKVTTARPGKEPTSRIGLALICLVLIAVVPLTLFSAVVSQMVVEQKRQAVAAELSSTARALRVNVDRLLKDQFASMAVLAGDASLDGGNLLEFQARAERIVIANPAWASIGLIDPATHRLLAASTSLSELPPQSVAPRQVDQVFQTGQPVIAGGFPASSITGTPIVLLMAPVTRKGVIKYVLGVAIDPKLLSDIFVEQQFPASWTGAIMDRNLALTGRSRDAERFFGRAIAPSMAREIRAGTSGMFRTETLDGQPVYSVYDRSPVTEWTVALGIPIQEIDAPVRQRLLRFFFIAASLIGLALTLAALTARLIFQRRRTYERKLHEGQARLEELLKESEDLYHNAPAGYHSLDLDGNFVRINHTELRWLGYEAEQLIGRKNIMDLLTPASRQLYADHLPLLMTNGNMQGLRLEMLRKDKSVLPVLLNATLVRDPQGNVMRSRAALFDQSEQLRIETQLQEAQRIAQIGSWEIDLLTDKMSCSDEIYQLYQLAPRQSLSRAATDRNLHHDDLALTREVFDAAVKSPAPFEVTHRVCTHDGGIKYVHVRGQTYFSADGTALRMAGTAQDVTTTMLQEQALKASELRYRSVVDAQTDMIARFRADGTILFVNEVLARFYRLPASAIIGSTWHPVVSPDDVARIDAQLQAMTPEQPIVEIEYRVQSGSGELRWLRFSNHALFDADGTLLEIQAVAQDITERKQVEQQLRIAAIAFESQEGMVVTDSAGVILKVNQAFVAITGYTAEEAVGQRTSMLGSGRHDPAFYRAMWQGILQKGSWQGEIWNRRKSGEVYPEWLTITAVKGESGDVSHYVATLTDITQRKMAEDEIRNLAFYDPLTKLPNRRLLQDRLQQALATSTRSGHDGALLFIDLDNFKTLNDTLGHDIGDLLLEQVASRLSACVRKGDTVSRLGGDEFVVIIEDLSDTDVDAATQTELIGEKIRSALNQPYQLAGHEHHSTPSIGATLFNQHNNVIEELFKRADLAMYQAKSAGRNTLRFFDPEMQAAVTARAALEADLRAGLQQEQFLLYLQPQVDSTGKVTGAEALVRWLHPQRGLMSPLHFIPLAEETGLILQLGQWVLRSACQLLVRWAAEPARAHLTLAVNVSARQFHHPDFAAQVRAALADSGANPHRLKLELTESLLLDDVDDVIAKMSELKAEGVGFSLDDFGTGYSSLSYLKRLPLDQLKIDQSFVRDVLLDQNDAAIAKTIVTLANSLDLAVIAEGVETAAQRDFLAESGCHAYQGYYFSRPLPLDEFDAFTP